MQELARIFNTASEAAAVDKFAQRTVRALVGSPPGEWSSAVTFESVPTDLCDVVAIAHRRRLRFEFTHHLVAVAPGRTSLAGRYNIYDVDLNGNLTGRSEIVDLYPPLFVVFPDGKQYEFPDGALAENAVGVRDAFARLAAKIAQSELCTTELPK